MSYLILIVEDEPKLSQSLSEYLCGIGYRTQIINNGLEVTPWVKAHQPALILLDLMLPGKDGIAVCQELRTFSQIPIIMVTARTDEIDRLIGLEIGADDFVCKPFSLRELAARIKAVIRRHEYVPINVTGRGLTLDRASSHLCYRGEKVALTAIECNIMDLLMSHPGRIFERDELLDVAYTDDRIVSDRTVDSHMKKIRRKLNQLTGNEKFVHSIYGVGYKFEP